MRSNSSDKQYLGWLIGFISKQEASTQMVNAPHPTFLLRFSDTQTGAVSIGFVCEDDGVKSSFLSIIDFFFILFLRLERKRRECS